MNLLEWINNLPTAIRIIAITGLAVIGHFVVRAIRQLSQWLLAWKVEAKFSSRETFTRRFPKFATITTIIVSGITFVIYFFAIGLILKEFKISLTAYLASASVIGLAIGFGLQGFVQDVVIGLTLIFSDALKIGDMVELSGQVGKVESIGLRFTNLVNLHGQTIYIPNRNIGMIGRFRRGAIRAFVDVQLPEQVDKEKVVTEVAMIAKSLYNQYKSIILSAPEILGIKEAKPAQWQYLRLTFHIWPGQGALIDSVFKQRVIAALKKMNPEYADWMVIVTWRGE